MCPVEREASIRFRAQCSLTAFSATAAIAAASTIAAAAAIAASSSSATPLHALLALCLLGAPLARVVVAFKLRTGFIELRGLFYTAGF